MNIAEEIQKTFSRTPKMRQIVVAQTLPVLTQASAMPRWDGFRRTRGVARHFHSPPYVTSTSRRVGEQQVRNNVA